MKTDIYFKSDRARAAVYRRSFDLLAALLSVKELAGEAVSRDVRELSHTPLQILQGIAEVADRAITKLNNDFEL